MENCGLTLLPLLGVPAAAAHNNQPPAVDGCVVEDSSIIENCCYLGYRYSRLGDVFYKHNVYTTKTFL